MLEGEEGYQVVNTDLNMFCGQIWVQMAARHLALMAKVSDFLPCLASCWQNWKFPALQICTVSNVKCISMEKEGLAHSYSSLILKICTCHHGNHKLVVLFCLSNP